MCDRQIGGVFQFQKSQIGIGVGTDYLGFQLPAVEKLDHDFGRIFHDVVVG